jgi:PadR family transcriptional regulator, regulatory protein PadR
MRRKPGELRPIEMDILEAGMRLRTGGMAEFHGFLVAKEMAEGREVKLLTAQGTLYRALNRLERDGLLESRWEDASEAKAGRPLRRLYRITAGGVRALEGQRAAQATHPGPSARGATA